MNLSDLLPGLVDGTSHQETFYQVLGSLQVFETAVTDGRLEIRGTEPAEDFLDRVADVYLGRLALSQLPPDQAISCRFDRATIRSSIHRLVNYTFVSPAEKATHRNQLLGDMPLGWFDLFPHSDQPGNPYQGTFSQALHQLKVVEYGLIGNATDRGTGPLLSAATTELVENFHDQLTDAYLTLLMASTDAHDIQLREKYSPSQIRANLHDLILYEHSPNAGIVNFQPLHYEKPPAKSFWQSIWG